jgi:hypothetical protein
MAAVAGSAVTDSRSDADIASADPGHIELGLQLRGYSVISTSAHFQVIHIASARTS